MSEAPLYAPPRVPRLLIDQLALTVLVAKMETRVIERIIFLFIVIIPLIGVFDAFFSLS